MNDGEEAVGSQSSHKQTLRALPVVDKLAAHGSVHALESFSQIVNLQWRPILAEAVRENSVALLGSTEIDNFVSDSLDASDTLDRERLACVMLYLSLDDTKSSPVINLQCIGEIRQIRKSRRSDCY